MYIFSLLFCLPISRHSDSRLPPFATNCGRVDPPLDRCCRPHFSLDFASCGHGALVFRFPSSRKLQTAVFRHVSLNLLCARFLDPRLLPSCASLRHVLSFVIPYVSGEPLEHTTPFHSTALNPFFLPIMDDSQLRVSKSALFFDGLIFLPSLLRLRTSVSSFRFGFLSALFTVVVALSPPTLPQINIGHFLFQCSVICLGALRSSARYLLGPSPFSPSRAGVPPFSDIMGELWSRRLTSLIFSPFNLSMFSFP